MKKIVWDKLRFPLIVGTMIALIAVGVVLMIRMLSGYSAVILENTDNQLISLARSVDQSVEGSLERYVENLVHTMEHAEREEVEKQWLSAGDAEGLLSFLEESLLGQDKDVATVLVLEDGAVKLSLDGNINYHFPVQRNPADVVSIQACLGESDDTYLAFVWNAKNGVEYAVLLDIAQFYEEITGDVSTELQNEIVMMDVDMQSLIHRAGTGIEVDAVEEFLESDSKFSMLSFLIEQQKAGEEGSDFCDAVSSATGRAYTARMAIVPATEETNGFFAIGVSTDYDLMTEPMRVGAMRLLFYGSMAIIGIVSLVIMLLYVFRGNQRALNELQLLREKNAAMEALNRQTQEFAHHQRLELMGTLTSGIAHEFNNLLAPIMGYSILVLEKLPPEETELYDEVLEIYNTSRKAKTVVSRLSDLARKNASTDFHELSMDEVVQKVVEMAKPAKPESVDIHLDLNCKEQIIVGNETQLSQLLLNLIINAFHATEENGGSVTITTEVEASGDVIVLKVSDNGCGIPKEVLPRIFEPFFTTKKGGKGTGLGLAIAQQMVEDHSGTITVDSKMGEGTTFFVEFPVNSL